MRRVCLLHGISGGEVGGLVGLWVDLDTVSDWQGAREGSRLAKIGAIGVRISQWVTCHGFALNVSTAPDLFQMIVPCGIRDHEVTSIFELSAARPDVESVARASLDSLSRIMDAEVTRFDDLSTASLEPWIAELRAGNSIDQTLPSL
jgi:lipoyl(octanoyl) transferase